jgi:hypothetical protein
VAISGLTKWGLVAATTAFWVAMNVLLWRAEYGHSSKAASTVPASLIWRKILTAPDLSSLTILHHGKKMGACRWSTSIAEELTSLSEDNAVAPERMARKIPGFKLHLEGASNAGNNPGTIRFDASLVLSSNQVWREFKLSVNARPAVFEAKASAADQAVRLSWDDGHGRLERVMAISDLGNPARVLDEVLGLQSGKLRARDLLLSIGPGNGGDESHFGKDAGLNFTAAQLKWEGSNEEMTLGHSTVRVYRLSAHLIGPYELKVFVSRVGEILRVDLPDELVLLNEQFVPPS